MLTALILSFSCLPASTAIALPQDPPEEKAETPADGTDAQSEIEEIKPEEAALQIKEALKSKEEIVMVAALENLGQIPSKLVTKEGAKGLKIKKEAVQMAAIEALRFNTDPTSLDYLLKLPKDKSIHGNVKTAEAYAYALGQKGDRKAIPALQDDLVGTSKTPTQIIKAKVLALGHIRHKDSVEALLDYTKTTVAGGRRGGVRKKVSREVHGSLVVLTGTDQGDMLQSWEDWWYDHRSKLKIAKEEWPLENARDQRAWDKLWTSPQEKEEAAKKAEEEKAKRKKQRDKGTESSSSSDSSESSDSSGEDF